MNNKNIANSFKNKTLLITVGTGSFGKTVLPRLINYNFKEIIKLLESTNLNLE
jgi:FlaA1/EpsC-like NDP-sugar epimerase